MNELANIENFDALELQIISLLENAHKEVVANINKYRDGLYIF